MSLFGKILKTVFDIVTASVEIIKDIATMGGAVNEQDETYTGKKLKQLNNDLGEIREELEKI